MTTAERLLARIAACGYRVALEGGEPVLRPARSGCVMPPRLLADLKANRAAVVAHLKTSIPAIELCPLCGRDVSDPVDRETVANNPLLCDRGGAKKLGSDADGNLKPASQRCPYKK